MKLQIMKLQKFAAGKLALVFWLTAVLLILPTILTAQEKIAFQTTRDGATEIYVMNTDGSNQTRLTYSAHEDFDPAFSPDGSKIAFTSNRDGNFEIYVMNADGTNQTRLTINSAVDDEASWSPDGNKIAFSSYRDGVAAEIYVMNADGTNPTRLTNNTSLEGEASFSPNGNAMIFQSFRDGNFEIYRMNTDGTNQVNLTNAAGNDTEADWSPNGTKIVFRGLRNGNMDVYLMNADGSNQVNLTSKNPTFDLQPSFSPDGTKIVFRTDRDANREIYSMNADGTGQTNLTNAAGDDTDPSWGGAISAPSTPTNFRVESVGTNQVQLAWTDTSNNEAGFAIERCSNHNCANSVEIGRAGANVTVYIDTALDGNLHYYYRMRAFNISGTSVYTDVVSAKTLKR